MRQSRGNTNFRRNTNVRRAAPRRQKAAPVHTGPFLWNPKAAILLSLVFTPIFGAAVHALNWRVLKEPRFARIALSWSLAGAAILLIGPLASLMSADAGNTRTADACAVALLLVHLISWLLLEAPRQQRYVRERLPRNYGRRSWKRPLAVTLAASFGYPLLAGLLTWLSSAAR